MKLLKAYDSDGFSSEERDHEILEVMNVLHTLMVLLYNKTVAYSFKDLTKLHQIWTEDTQLIEFKKLT